MKILAVADTEERWLTDPEACRERTGDVDLIVSCGDLPARYLEHVVTIYNEPLVYVWGNHDSACRDHAPEGCMSLEGRMREVAGLRVMGLGGSLRYNSSVFGFSEREMYWRMLKLALTAKARGGIDLLITHAPARGYGDLDDLPHQGFEAFNTALEILRPRYLLHGHVHPEYARIHRLIEHPSGTQIINCCGYQILEW